MLACTNSRPESQIHWHWFTVCCQSAEQLNCLQECVKCATAGWPLSTSRRNYTLAVIQTTDLSNYTQVIQTHLFSWAIRLCAYVQLQQLGTECHTPVATKLCSHLPTCIHLAPRKTVALLWSLFFSPSLSTKTSLKNLYKKRLLSQHKSIISTIKVSKISTGKPSSWETSILLGNFIPC